MPKKTFSAILLIVVVVLMLLPFINTFQEALTRIILKLSWYRIIEVYLLPFETRMIVMTVQILGFKAIAAPTTVSIFQNGVWNKIVISWNCIGWQSLVLLGITFTTGFTENYSRYSKLQVLILGIAGTLIVNIVRIAIVSLSIIFVPQIPAEVLHNYLSSFITIVWLFFFWWFSYSFILEDRQPNLQSQTELG